ncbi:MAG: type VI secretion system contractile sheath large subunit, partial [Candidatus Electrothrix sp. ATG2]|nr:type VI secretion system contractile sheath large subunit [Candidatus Electrothrix sp. ATG2]
MTEEQGQLAPGEEQAAEEVAEETPSLLAEITQATKLKPADEAYAMARLKFCGLGDFCKQR